MQLISGANIALTGSEVEISIQQVGSQNIAADMSAYLLDQTSLKVRGDQDMVFYGQTQNQSGSVKLVHTAQTSRFSLQLDRIDSAIGKVAITASLDAPHTFASASMLQIELKVAGQLLATATIEAKQRTEAALIIGEFYKRNQEWKFRLIDQGFNGGLKPLAEHFGVDISSESPASPTPVKPAPVSTPTPSTSPASTPINLRKISLDKTNSSINLTKKANGFGEIKINLNWNQQPAAAQKPSFFDRLKGAGTSGIDLDLGCFFEMKDGSKSVIQALGKQFGEFDRFPFIKLSDDDRSGTSKDGEWLRINGQHWGEIKRIVIFAFIYQGVPNWSATDGVVSIYVPDQAPIEIKLQEGSGNLAMCGIAELINDQGNIQVSRKMNYVAGHRELDQLFGFGMRWRSGSK